LTPNPDIIGWDYPNPNPNRDRYRDRSDMTLGHEKVDFDPDSDFDPDENGSQQTEARDAHSSRQ
jgi:hypothetical protein